MNKYYGVLFYTWRGPDWDDLVAVFRNEEDAYEFIGSDENWYAPDEGYTVWTMTEEQVKKYWKDEEIS